MFLPCFDLEVKTCHVLAAYVTRGTSEHYADLQKWNRGPDSVWQNIALIRSKKLWPIGAMGFITWSKGSVPQYMVQRCTWNPPGFWKWTLISMDGTEKLINFMEVLNVFGQQETAVIITRREQTQSRRLQWAASSLSMMLHVDILREWQSL